MNFLICFLSLFISSAAYSSLGYDYGSSASLFGTGGVSNLDELDAANAHALPALMVQTDKNLFSFNLNYIAFDFDTFDNILIASEVNNAGTTDIYGSHDPSPSNSLLLSVHGSFKLFKSIPGKINFSLYTPIDKLAEIQTGDPYLPEYPMHKKLERFMFEFSYAHRLETFSFSIGALGGIQSKGETFVVAKEGGSPIPSSAEISQNATPSLSLNLSIYKELEGLDLFFKFQDQVKSQIENDLDSFLSTGGGGPTPASIDFNWQMDSLMFYDPRTYELGARFKLSNYNLITSLEYQDWSGFESPRLNLKNNGGILVSSDTQVNYKSQNILIPTISIIQNLEKMTLSYFIKYSPSPLKLYNDRNGNTLDLDRSIVGLSLSREISYLQDKFNLSFGLQYHHMHSQKIEKSGPREDGDATKDKIGSGGYEARGRIIATSIGINWVI